MSCKAPAYMFCRFYKDSWLHWQISTVLYITEQSMFSEAECSVKWDSCISEILKNYYGVLQGGMLSPNLFTEFLKDMFK